MTKTNRLTTKQLLFCKEYLIDKNATNAAIRAGYSKKTARAIGYENLTKPVIMHEIEKNLKKITDKIEISAERVLTEISRLAFANIENYVKINSDGTASIDFSTMTSEQAAALQSIETETFADSDGNSRIKTKFKLADKRTSLDLLGKHLKLFSDKVLHEHKGSVEIKSDLSGKTKEELTTLAFEKLKEWQNEESA